MQEKFKGILTISQSQLGFEKVSIIGDLFTAMQIGLPDITGYVYTSFPQPDSKPGLSSKYAEKPVILEMRMFPKSCNILNLFLQ